MVAHLVVVATPEVEKELARTDAKIEPGFQVGVRELAWMAGVLDMKGRIMRVSGQSRKNPIYRLMVETSNIQVAARLAKFTGVKYNVAEARRLDERYRRGCKDHCPDAHQHVTAVMPTIGRWDVSGVGAIIILANLMPYFVADTEKHQGFLDEALKLVPPPDPKRQGWAAVARTINRLHGLGWRIPEELLPAKPK